MTTREHAMSRTTTTHDVRSAARGTATLELPFATLDESLATTCPTCQAAGAGAADLMPGASHPGVTAAECPTCGVVSVEYGLTLAIDATLAEMCGLDRLADSL